MAEAGKSAGSSDDPARDAAFLVSHKNAISPESHRRAPQTAAEQELVLLPPTEEDQLKTLRFLLKTHLSVTEVDALQAATRDGRVDAGTLIREVSAARATLGMQMFIAELRKQLV